MEAPEAPDGEPADAEDAGPDADDDVEPADGDPPGAAAAAEVDAPVVVDAAEPAAADEPPASDPDAATAGGEGSDFGGCAGAEASCFADSLPACTGLSRGQNHQRIAATTTTRMTIGSGDGFIGTSVARHNDGSATPRRFRATRRADSRDGGKSATCATAADSRRAVRVRGRRSPGAFLAPDSCAARFLAAFGIVIGVAPARQGRIPGALTKSSISGRPSPASRLESPPNHARKNPESPPRSRPRPSRMPPQAPTLRTITPTSAGTPACRRNGRTTTRHPSSVAHAAFCGAALSFLLAPPSATAQDYPNRPITLVSPAAAGGSNEVLKTVIFDRLAAALGVPIVMESRSGAGGAIGASIAAKAAPDGHTLLIAGTSVMSANPATRRDLPYDPIRDFTPIVTMIDAAPFLVAHKSVPARDARAFVAWLRAQPGRTNYGSYGPGSSNFLIYERFKQATGTDVLHVPYRGSAPLLAALLGGEVQSAVEYYPTMRAQVDAGTIRVLGVASAARSPLLPDVPTLAEQGIGVATGAFIWLVAPAGLPAAIADRLNEEMNRILALPEVRRRMAEIGYAVAGGTRSDAQAKVAEELDRWKRLARDIRYQPD